MLKKAGKRIANAERGDQTERQQKRHQHISFFRIAIMQREVRKQYKQERDGKIGHRSDDACCPGSFATDVVTAVQQTGDVPAQMDQGIK